VTSKSSHGGRRYAPYAFTEHGAIRTTAASQRQSLAPLQGDFTGRIQVHIGVSCDDGSNPRAR